MPNLRAIRRRIRSVGNTAKVTRAMQMVAASKMRRAQEQVLAGRPYAEKLRQVLGELTSQGVGDTDFTHPLLERRPIQKSLMVHFTPDRGLCGGLPSNINRWAAQFILGAPAPVAVITIGRKGRDFMVRSRQDVAGVFTDLGDRPALADVLPIVHLVEQMYSTGDVDQVVFTYTRFVNTIVQQPTAFQVLPLEQEQLAQPIAAGEYLYEPDATQVLGALLPRFLEMQVYHALLESIASEQSARMVAMRNATDAANDMVDALTLDMNKVRQEAITNELLDLVGGAAALSG